MSYRAAALVAACCAVLPAARAGAQRSGSAQPPSTKAPALAPAPRSPAAPSVPEASIAPATDADVERVLVSPGRSRPLTLGAPITRIAIADTNVADALVVSDRDLVFTGRKLGESDVLVWSGGRRLHYRAIVGPPADRRQVMLAVKFAEVRRDLIKNIGLSVRARRLSGSTVVGGTSGAFSPLGGYASATTTASQFPDAITGAVTGFGTLVTDFGARGVLAALDLEEQRGNAHTLAEPTLMAANGDSASFLAGGEFPVPAASTVTNGVPFVTIVFKEFGVRLSFTPEVLNDTLVKLHVRPEVSGLDYNNAVALPGGVRVPALRTRRLESTIDVPRDQSLIISGLMDDERQKVRTGIPGLMDVPVLGSLFSSTRWQRNETELLIVVTPVVIDPSRPRSQDLLRLKPDERIPAREVIDPRLATPPAEPSAAPNATPSAPKQP